MSVRRQGSLNGGPVSQALEETGTEAQVSEPHEEPQLIQEVGEPTGVIAGEESQQPSGGGEVQGWLRASSRWQRSGFRHLLSWGGMLDVGQVKENVRDLDM